MNGPYTDLRDASDAPHAHYDMDAERSVLGAVIMSPQALMEAADAGVTGAAFWAPAHETIWAAVAALADAGDPTDALAVAGRLRASGDLERVGGHAYLHTLVAQVPSTASVTYYAKIVLDAAGRRRIDRTGAVLAQLSLQRDTPLEALVAQAQAQIEALDSTGATTDSAVTMDDLFADVLNSADPALAPPQGWGVRWGIADVDAVIDPIEPGQLAVVMGYSGGGKTVCELTVARAAAIGQGKTVLIHTIEMGRIETGRRLVCAEARVDMGRMKRRELRSDDLDRIEAAEGRLRQSRIIVDDRKVLTLADLDASIRRHKPDLVIVDQIPIMTPPDQSAPREQQLSAIAYGLKIAAGRHKCAVLAANQLNRAAIQRTDKKPSMHDARGSSDVVNAADVVVIIWDPTGGDLEHARTGETDLIVAKQRDGRSGVDIPVALQGHYGRIVGLAS